jgi:peptidoglycan/LPS O-acetylase OafA/YrhL
VGCLRFSLAFLVVYGHCYYPFGRFGLGGENAVQIFYLISGFYMTLVLREKYAAPGTRDLRAFYVNRWLRIYPAYILMAAATLFFCIAADWLGWQHDAARYFSRWWESGLLDWTRSAWLFLSQLTMIGLDSFVLTTLDDNGDIVPLTDEASDHLDLWRLLLVGQAWSLSVEIYFYALAPFLVTRSLRTVVWVAAASYGARLGMLGLGLYHDPWSYRFFPSELMFFLAGSIAYRLYACDDEMKDLQLREKGAICVAIIAMIFGSVWIGKFGQPMRFAAWIPPFTTAAVFLALPALFHATRKNALDRLAGELSYPIYVSHALIISIVGQGSYNVGKQGFVLVSLLVLLVSYALYRLVDAPIDNLRHRYTARLPAARARP